MDMSVAHPLARLSVCLPFYASILTVLQILSAVAIAIAIAIAIAVAVAVIMSSLRDLAILPDCSTQATWPDVKHALDNWAVASKFSYRTAKKTPEKARYTCRIAGCPWVVNVSRATDGMLEMRVTERQHTCFGAALPKRQSVAKKEWLDEAIPHHLLVTKSTKPREVEETIKVHYAETISYKVAQLAVQRLLDGGLGKQRYSFQLLPSYCDTVELRCPRATVDLQINHQTGKF